MVDLQDLEQLQNYSLGLLTGRYTSEEVVKFFRGVYGPRFSSHDLTKVCRILNWKISRRSGKSDIVSVK